MIYRFRDTLNASINFFSMMASVEMFRAAFPQKINEDAKKRLMAYLLAAELDTEVREHVLLRGEPLDGAPRGRHVVEDPAGRPVREQQLTSSRFLDITTSCDAWWGYMGALMRSISDRPS